MGNNKKDGPKKEIDDAWYSRRRFWIGVLALLLLLGGIVGVTITCFVLEQKVLQYRHHYGAIFDAGSTHTDVTVYRWPSEYKDHGTAHTEQVIYQRCSDAGMSSFQNSPESAGQIIKECIENLVLKVVPQKDVKKTVIYFGATAGLRLLCTRDPDKCDKILESVRRAVNSFKFRQTKAARVRVLSGMEEGTFGWITANILKGRLKSDMPSRNNSLIGSLDLGGGSTEVTFVPENIKELPEEYKSQTVLYGVNYTLYTHSYQCYGFKEAQRRLMAHLVEASNYSRNVINPCWHKGYNASVSAGWIWLHPCSKQRSDIKFTFDNSSMFNFVGNGSADACANRIRDLFSESKCHYTNCTWDASYQPTLHGHFVAHSGFAYVGSFFNISIGDQLLKLKTSAEKFCPKTWPEVEAENPDRKIRYLSEYCFEALYAYTFLTHGLHFPPESNDVQIVENINGTEVNWSLGFMVNATKGIPNESPTYRLTQQEFITLLVMCCMMVMIGVGMLTICVIRRKFDKNDQHKYSPVN